MTEKGKYWEPPSHPATFVGLQEEAVVGVVVEEILGEGGSTEGVFED